MTKWLMTVMGMVGGILLLSSLAVQAGTWCPGIDRRQAIQQQRIYQGVNSGMLTPREFHRLEHQQARLQRAENRMKADGRFTRWERYRLNRMLDRSGAGIYRLKHNCRVY